MTSEIKQYLDVKRPFFAKYYFGLDEPCGLDENINQD